MTTRCFTLAVFLVLLTACSESPSSNPDGGAADIEAREMAFTDVRVMDSAHNDAKRTEASADVRAMDSAHNDAERTEASADDLLAQDQKEPAGVILRVTFDDALAGPYQDSDMRAEWEGTVWSVLDRAAIVEGAEAKSGRSLRIFYPQGGVGPGKGGAQWRVELSQSYDELYCAYWVKFGSGFDFVKGGKLPGLVGGAANTGGDKPTGTDGWSARMMWGPDGKALQYLYHPDQPSTWGDGLDYDIGGQRHFEPGTWHRMEHRIVMNTPGAHDGIVQGWWDGQLALDRRNIRFRDVDSFSIDAFYFSTFFGGNTADQAPTKDEYVYFDDFIIATSPITH